MKAAFVTGIGILILAAGPFACGPATEDTQTPVKPGKATQAGKPRPLSPEATVPLAKLTPVVAKPVNKPYERKLPKNAKLAMAKAQTLRKQQNYAGAIEQLERAMGFDPNNPHIRLLLGMTYVSLPNYGKATSHLRAAEKYLGDDVKLQVVLGRLALLQNQNDLATLKFRTALLCSNAKPSNPRTAYALLFLGRMLQKKGYWTAANECYAKLEPWLLEHSQTYQSESALRDFILCPEKLAAIRGQLLGELGREKDAIVVLSRVRRRNRSDIRTAQLLLGLLVKTGQFKEAQKLLLDMASQPIFRPVIPTLAKRLCIVAKDKSMPGRIFKALGRKKLVPLATSLALAEAAYVIGAPDEAGKIIAVLLKKSPDNTKNLLLLVQLSAKAGYHSQAITLLVDNLQKNPRNTEIVQSGIKKIVAAKPPEKLLREFSKTTYTATGPKKFALHYVAGEFARQSDKALLAGDQFKRAIDAKKDFLGGYEALADVYVAAGKPEDVELVLKRAQKLTPGYFYHYLTGRARLTQGKADEAVEALELAHQANPKHLPAMLKLAEAYQKLAKTFAPRSSEHEQYANSSQMTLLKALRQKPKRLSTYHILFNQFLQQRDFDNAQEIALLLLEKFPQKPDGLLMGIEVCIRSDEYKKARKLMLRLAKRFPGSPQIPLLIIRIDTGRHKGVLPKAVFDRSIDRLDRILQGNPTDAKALRMLAQLLSSPVPGHYAKAATIWQRLYRQDKNNIIAAKGYAYMLFKARQFAKAEKVLGLLLKRLPKDRALHHVMLEVLVRQKKIDQAVQMAKTWSVTKRQWRGVMIALLTQDKQYDKALELLSKQSKGVSAAYVRQRKIQILIAARCFANAVEVAEASGIAETEIAIQTADLLLKHKQYAKALALLEKKLATLKKSSFQESMLRRQVIAYVGNKQYDKAATIVNEQLAKTGLKAAIFFPQLLYRELMLARQYDRVDKLVAGLMKKYKAAAQDDPAVGKFRAWLKESTIHIAIARGKFEQALKLVDGFIAESPANAELHNLRATVLGELGKTKEAIAAWEKAIELDGKNPSYKNNFAYTLSETGIQLDRAERLSKEALRGAGFIYYSFMDTLAWIHYKQTRFGEAAEIFLHLLPDDSEAKDGGVKQEMHPLLWDHAGDVFYRLGWKKRALRYWKTGVKEAKDYGSSSPEIRKLLKHTPKKIQALQANRKVDIAPLGKKYQPGQTTPKQKTKKTTSKQKKQSKQKK
ncbi:MAG: tetratricopeptide repeat protein [Phycisphaerae bacterium]|nr:tetratricopeptide repeat protein [Phycisphaerae bacterium]